MPEHDNTTQDYLSSLAGGAPGADPERASARAASASPQAVIFDLDGVLADSEGLHVLAWQRLFAERDWPFQQRWAREWVGVPDVEIAAEVAERFSEGVSSNRLVYSKRQRFRELVREGLKAFPGVVQEIEACRDLGIPVAVGTSSARAEAVLMLGVMGFADYFPVVVAGDDVPRVKPAPDIYLAAAEGLGVPVQRCIVVEDSPGGIAAARSAGASVVAVTSSFPRERLAAAQRVFPGTAEAIRWIRSQCVTVTSVPGGREDSNVQNGID
jgi:HAD superfamily hydrolase (TIGR01509 family)